MQMLTFYFVKLQYFLLLKCTIFDGLVAREYSINLIKQFLEFCKRKIKILTI